MDISKENVEVFTWKPHGLDIEPSASLARRMIDQGYLRDYVVGAPGVLEGKIIVDAACGRGPKTCALASLGAARTIGIDGSVPSIAAAGELASKMGITNVEFHVGLLEDLRSKLGSLGVEKADLVFNSFNIHHVSDWRAIISVFSDLIRTGGYLYINWTTLGRGWGGFLIKNRIAFTLGRDAQSRLRIGRFLFGWRDRRLIKNEGKDLETFYADRYSAYYKFITLGQMTRALKLAGLDVIQVSPPTDILDMCLRGKMTPRKRQVARLVGRLPILSPVLSFALRVRQFMRRGDIRALVCVRSERANLLADL